MSEVAVIVTSKLRSIEDRDAFLELSRRTRDWLNTQPDFRRYELFGGDLSWTDIMIWADRASADAGNAAFSGTEIARNFETIVAPGYRSFIGTRFELEGHS